MCADLNSLAVNYRAISETRAEFAENQVVICKEIGEYSRNNNKKCQRNKRIL